MTRGVVAAGHEITAGAAAEILRAGGNAFDAILAGFFAACVAEPVLTSLGGGGFLHARPAQSKARVYDFFCQTPRRKRPQAEVDFQPIVADFGPDQQEFHIGLGAVATPGAVAGMFRIHEELGSLPMLEIMQPAISAARQGVKLTAFQAYVFNVVKAIYGHEAEARALYGCESQAGWRLLQEAEQFHNPALADLLERLASEGSRLFYEGEVADLITGQCAGGGHLQKADLAGYEVIRRQPLAVRQGSWLINMNPPPASGGLLVALGLELLHDVEASPMQLAEVLRLTQQARLAAEAEDRFDEQGLLDSQRLSEYRQILATHASASRGTTHISVLDSNGNAAAMTVSNGEGCGHLLPGCGFMLNNMLGEEDLHPDGFHRWPENRRLTSMMCPGIAQQDNGDLLVLGSGGSNRIRSALLQVLVKRLSQGLSLAEAIEAPRMHFEQDLLSIEGGHAAATLDALRLGFPSTHVWEERNLFFGGVHAVESMAGQLTGHGDSRRDGCSMTV